MSKTSEISNLVQERFREMRQGDLVKLTLKGSKRQQDLLVEHQCAGHRLDDYFMSWDRQHLHLADSLRNIHRQQTFFATRGILQAVVVSNESHEVEVWNPLFRFTGNYRPVRTIHPKEVEYVEITHADQHVQQLTGGRVRLGDRFILPVGEEPVAQATIGTLIAIHSCIGLVRVDEEDRMVNVVELFDLKLP